MSVQAKIADCRCWYCGADADSHFCPQCQHIQPSRSPVDYFTFFNLPLQFHVDTNELERRFYDLSRKFHPDFFSNATPEEQRYSMDRASRLNDAYRTLKDSWKRAAYLLEIVGMPASERKSQTPPDLLAEIFELNEQMEELRAAKQGKDTGKISRLQTEVLEMEQMLKARAQQLAQKLAQLFAEWQTAPQARPLLAQINGILAQCTYINNLIDDIDAEFND